LALLLLLLLAAATLQRCPQCPLQPEEQQQQLLLLPPQRLLQRLPVQPPCCGTRRVAKSTRQVRLALRPLTHWLHAQLLLLLLQQALHSHLLWRHHQRHYLVLLRPQELLLLPALHLPSAQSHPQAQEGTHPAVTPAMCIRALPQQPLLPPPPQLLPHLSLVLLLLLLHVAPGRSWSCWLGQQRWGPLVLSCDCWSHV
jgi:hypothetical protein